MAIEKYYVENGHLIIQDSELKIHIEEPFTPLRISSEDRISRTHQDSKLEIVQGKGGVVEKAFWTKKGKMNGECHCYYPDGAIKNFSFYLDGLLHGPFTFLSPGGTLLALSWFVHGKQEGKSWQYYASGELYCRLRYHNDAWHGVQEYFYPDGTPKTVMTYSNGKLKKAVLYDYKGNVEREMDFGKAAN